MVQSIRRNSQRIGRMTLVLAALVLVLSAALPALAQDTVVVLTGNNVNLRGLPGTYGQVLSVVPIATTLTATAISEDGLWLQVAYDGLSGWIALSYVTLQEGYLAYLPVAADPVASVLVESETEADDSTSDLDLLIALWASINGDSTATTTATTTTSTTSTTTSAVNANGLPKVIITFPTSGLELPNDQITLTWLARSGAASYRIEVYSDQTENPYSATYRTTGTSFSVRTSGLPARSTGWGYWFEVSALDSTGRVIAADRIWGMRIDRSPSTPSGGFSGRFPFPRP